MIPESSSPSFDFTSSVITPGWTHEVFISFTAIDTHSNFVSHLYDALHRAGIATFKEDKSIEQDNPIDPELAIKAIKGSRFAVVVFSKHYADFSWCLDELSQIIELGMKVFPVFYHVDPSEVRKQTGKYGAAIAKHEAGYQDHSQVEKWRRALTKAANTSGWDVPKTANGNEAECIKLIVGRILAEKGPYVADNIFGMEVHLRKLEPILNSIDRDSNGVLTIGILGPPGIGKTTIAQAVYGRISSKFEGSCFVENIRENGSTNSGLRSLQEYVLTKITGTAFKVGSRLEGVQEMSSRLKNKRVLLVLDDVDDAEQLEALAESHWFRKGSMIIITTRDENVLPTVSHVYRPHRLDESDAIQVFSVHAFQQSHPPVEYEELSKEIVSYADGLPLALKGLGSFMKGVKEAKEWRSAIRSLAAEPQGMILYKFARR